MMPYFWIIWVLIILSLIVGESKSDLHAEIRNWAFWILAIIGIAVAAIDSRFGRIVKQLSDEGFDAEAEDRREWSSARRVFVGLLTLLAIATIFQGGFRCVSKGADITMACIWQGTKDQLADDFGIGD